MTIKKHLILLWIGCVVGAWSLLPYLYYLGMIPAFSATLLILSTAQAALFFGLILWLSGLMIPKTDLQPFSKSWRALILPGISVGILVGLLIAVLERTVFEKSELSAVHPPYWAGALASLYGGINEEVLLRLFLFTFIYFCLSKFGKNRSLLLWITNISVALSFGFGHLPAALKLGPLSGFELFRILLLNGIAGIAFGWLYWSKGFYAAVLAHFVTDIIIHALFM